METRMSGTDLPNADMPRFLSGWRYIETVADAAELPSGTVAIVNDPYLWDGDDWRRKGYWDGVVDCNQRDFIHGCEYSKCSNEDCRFVWNENGDLKDKDIPELPFYAWHPTFCTDVPEALTTIAQLDALPVGSVIRDNEGDVLKSYARTKNQANAWMAIGGPCRFLSDEIPLPATLLGLGDK